MVPAQVNTEHSIFSLVISFLTCCTLKKFLHFKGWSNQFTATANWQLLQKWSMVEMPYLIIFSFIIRCKCKYLTDWVMCQDGTCFFVGITSLCVFFRHEVISSPHQRVTVTAAKMVSNGIWLLKCQIFLQQSTSLTFYLDFCSCLCYSFGSSDLRYCYQSKHSSYLVFRCFGLSRTFWRTHLQGRWLSIWTWLVVVI